MSVLYIIAPALAPTDIGFVSVSSTSVLFVWKNPSRESLNGIVRSYSLQLTEEYTGKTLLVTSKSRQNLFEGLHPFYNYTLRVAAFTVAIGPFSDPFTVTTLPDSKAFYCDIHVHLNESVHYFYYLSYPLFEYRSKWCTSSISRKCQFFHLTCAILGTTFISVQEWFDHNVHSASDNSVQKCSRVKYI